VPARFDFDSKARKDRDLGSARSCPVTTQTTASLIYAGRLGTGMPDKELADLRGRLEPPGASELATERATAAQDPLRIAACSFPPCTGLSHSSSRRLPI
jgi:ATP-dependent DNA ligase